MTPIQQLVQIAVATLKRFLVLEEFSLKEKAFIAQEDRVFRKNKENDMLVEENQYRAVITFHPSKYKWSASVQRRLAINEWAKVRCGLKGETFDSKEVAESIARDKIRLQKALDNLGSSPVSYIVYDD